MFKPAFNPEPPFAHGQAPRTAVLLCNLGTPDEPSASAVRRYLAEFLGDHRVVEIPRLIWMAILHGIILRIRPAKSAAKYATIWTSEGSPLKVWTNKQAEALQQVFNAHGEAITVRYAMRYGNPSMPTHLMRSKLKATREFSYCQPTRNIPAPQRPVCLMRFTTGACKVASYPSSDLSTITTTTQPTSKRSRNACVRTGLPTDRPSAW